MYINFRSVNIVGFSSINSANINLTSQGIVIVKGINQYEDNSSSNGSGKSSVFEAILWCIYGQTSAGITDPTNRYLNKGCYVKLGLSIDSIEYTIIRTIKYGKLGSTLILAKNGEDISGRNKTDTEKIIKSDIITISKDIFLSTMFLSQGFSNRISALAPSGRKERIEILTGTDEQIELFKNKVSAMKDSIQSDLTSTNNQVSFKQGELQRINKQIEQIEHIILSSSDNKIDYTAEEINIQLDKFNNYIASIKPKLDELSKRKSDLSIQNTRLKSDIDRNESKIRKLKQEISKLSEDKVCPTCGHSLNPDKSEELIKKYSSEIEGLILSNTKTKSDLDKIVDEYNLADTEVRALNDKIKNANSKIYELNSILVELANTRDTTADKEKLVELKSEAHDISEEINRLTSISSELEHKLSISNHCIQLITKKFRGYLLTNIIDYINVRLEGYSKMLFSNSSDIVKLVIDAAKLDIYLGDALYDTLSGGEKRKVDMALVLAQRDLALGIAGTTSNILILDEVMDNLDEVATNIVLGVIDSIADTVDSIFIISHNNYDISYDKIMTVTKNVDRTSTVEMS